LPTGVSIGGTHPIYESLVEPMTLTTVILSPAPSIRVRVTIPEAPVQVSIKGLLAITLYDGFVKCKPVEEGFAADELLVESVLEGATDEEVGTAALELLYPDETPVLEVLALEVLEEEGMGPAELVDIWELPPEPIVGDGMTSVWLFEVWAVESDPDTGALGEVAALDVTRTELDIGVLVLSSPKLLDNCEVITEVITVNESMADV
jgi:hypothetical protein